MIQFDRQITVPADFAVGLQTERPELLRRINRALTQEEGHAVADAMATLLSSLMRARARAKVLEDRLNGVGLDLITIKKVIQTVGLELTAVKKRTENLGEDDDEREEQAGDVTATESSADRGTAGASG